MIAAIALAVAMSSPSPTWCQAEGEVAAATSTAYRAGVTRQQLEQGIREQLPADARDTALAITAAVYEQRADARMTPAQFGQAIAAACRAEH